MSSLRVILSGGLGNQLFQYASAYAFAKKTGRQLILDMETGFRSDHFYKRSYELDVFPDLDFQDSSVRPSKRAWIWLRARHRCPHPRLCRALGVVDEGLHGSTPVTEFDSMGENALLIGFWQDEAHFVEYRDAIRATLGIETTKAPSTAVAVHVRRVEYTRGVKIDYFEKAIQDMRGRLDRPEFHIYTDDPEWGAAYCASREDYHLRSELGGSALDDFRAMSGYMNLITSNSTFSWWAAWLAEKPNSQIITPSSEFWSNPASPPSRWASI